MQISWFKCNWLAAADLDICLRNRFCLVSSVPPPSVYHHGKTIAWTYAGFILHFFSADLCRDRLPENCLKPYDGEDLLIQPEVHNSTVFKILGASYAIYSLKGKGASMQSWLIYNWLIIELRNNKVSAEPLQQSPVPHVKHCGRVDQGPNSFI